MPTILKTKNSVTTTVVPTTLQQGELAVNITDKKMWVGNAATTPVQILGAGTTGTAAGSNTQVQYNSSGTLAGDADFTFNGTTVTMTNDASISGLTVGKGGGALTDNTTVGYLALNVNTTGAYNTAVGRQTLTSNITGAENAAFGWSSLYSNTGSNNTALGATSLYANTSGGSNTAVGNQALRFNTTASNNTAVGYQAGYSATTGADNVHLGYRAGYSRTTGAGNTIVGDSAGYSLTTGHANTFVGAGQYSTNGAGYYVTTGSNNTVLGGYDGNQGGLDIRTASNYAVISDGAGNPLISTSLGRSVALEGAVPQIGEGITYPATQNASSNANTLDDYEEGTFTPVIGGTITNPTVTYLTSNTFGYYTKIGRSVSFVLEVRTSARSGGSGDLIVGGLPFNAGLDAANYEFAVSLYNISFNSANVYTAELQTALNYVVIRGSVSNGISANLVVGDWSNTNPTLIRITGTYFVA